MYMISVGGKQHGVHSSSVDVVTVGRQSLNNDRSTEADFTAYHWSGAVWRPW